MKKFLIITALIFIAWIGYNLIHNQMVIGGNSSFLVSKNKEFSKENGFFYCDFIPAKDSITLKSQRVQADTAWGEAPWWIGKNSLSLPKIYNGKRSMTIVIPRSLTKYRFEFLSAPLLVQSSTLQKDQQNFTMFYRYTNGTLKFAVVSKEYDESWEKGEVTDTITYIPAKND